MWGMICRADSQLKWYNLMHFVLFLLPDCCYISSTRNSIPLETVAGVIFWVTDSQLTLWTETIRNAKKLIQFIETENENNKKHDISWQASHGTRQFAENLRFVDSNRRATECRRIFSLRVHSVGAYSQFNHYFHFCMQSFDIFDNLQVSKTSCFCGILSFSVFQ